GLDGSAVLPMSMALVRYDSRRNEATYRGVRGGGPTCGLQIRNKGKGTYEFTLACKNTDGAAIPTAPQLCSGGSKSTTTLTTTFELDGTPAVRVGVTQPWRCLGSHGVVNQLKSADGASAPNDSGGSGPGDATNRVPKADFRIDPTSGTAPLTVRFSNASSDADGDAITSSWDFGDGFTSTDRSPTHLFTSAGAFTVTLVVTDARGLSSTPRQQSITVRAATSGGSTGTPGTPGSSGPPTGGSNAPRADFRADPASGTAPLTVHFSNRSSDPDGDTLTSSWDFGDGFAGTDPSPAHIFTSAGEFTVTLVVTDAAGLTSEPKRESITVRGASAPDDGTPEGENRPPRADFRADPMSGPAPLAVHFTNRSADPDGDFMVSN